MKSILRKYHDPANSTAINIQKANVQLNDALEHKYYNDADALAGVIRKLSEALYFMGEGKK